MMEDTMPKNGNGSSKLKGPLYAGDSNKSLGGTPVAGPKGGQSTPDPLNYVKAKGGK